MSLEGQVDRAHQRDDAECAMSEWAVRSRQRTRTSRLATVGEMRRGCSLRMRRLCTVLEHADRPSGHIDRFPVDIGGLVGDEERHDVGNVLRLPQAAQGNLLCKLLA